MKSIHPLYDIRLHVFYDILDLLDLLSDYALNCLGSWLSSKLEIHQKSNFLWRKIL
jgi:hypothetical protein